MTGLSNTNQSGASAPLTTNEVTYVMEKLRTWKLTWMEDYYYRMRWFKSKKQAENWAWSQLIDKNVCYAGQIQITSDQKINQPRGVSAPLTVLIGE